MWAISSSPQSAFHVAVLSTPPRAHGSNACTHANGQECLKVLLTLGCLVVNELESTECLLGGHRLIATPSKSVSLVFRPLSPMLTVMQTVPRES